MERKAEKLLMPNATSKLIATIIGVMDMVPVEGAGRFGHGGRGAVAVKVGMDITPVTQPVGRCKREVHADRPIFSM